MLKAKTSEKFLSKNLQNFDLLGALEIRGYEKLRFLLQKAQPCVNPRRLSHFASKSVGRSDLQRWAGKKIQKVTRGSHRNDVSPSTQGLRYRAACDTYVGLLVFARSGTWRRGVGLLKLVKRSLIIIYRWLLTKGIIPSICVTISFRQELSRRSIMKNCGQTDRQTEPKTDTSDNNGHYSSRTNNMVCWQDWFIDVEILTRLAKIRRKHSCIAGFNCSCHWWCRHCPLEGRHPQPFAPCATVFVYSWRQSA